MSERRPSVVAATAAAPASPWQPASFDAPAPEAVVADAAAADLAAIYATARQTGFEEGWQAGFAEGRTAGYEQGLITGHASGVQTGRAAGHKEGHTAGLAEGRAIASEHAERLAALTAELAQGLRALEENMGQALLTLALTVAQKIVGDTLAQHPEAILDCLREALHLESNAAPLRLWLHPDDLEIVNAHLPDEWRGRDCRLVGETSIARGGCRVETAFGEIDATLEARWRQAVTALTGSSESSGSSGSSSP